MEADVPPEETEEETRLRQERQNRAILLTTLYEIIMTPPQSRVETDE